MTALRPFLRRIATLTLVLSTAIPGVVQAQGSNAHPSVSPDGRRIVFDSDRTGNGDVYVMNADGTGAERLTEGPAMDMGAEWWDGGRVIAFARYEGRGRPHRYLIDSDGRNLRPMEDERQIHWSWSGDGSMVLTGPLDDTESSFIWVQNADGTDRRLLTELRPHSLNSDMSFSPDKRTVLFESFIGSTRNAGVYVVALDGGSPRRLATGTDPSWSPDGTQIAFKYHDPATDRYWLHVIDANGSHGRMLGEGTNPRWFPDSRRIAYMAPVDAAGKSTWLTPFPERSHT